MSDYLQSNVTKFLLKGGDSNQITTEITQKPSDVSALNYPSMYNVLVNVAQTMRNMGFLSYILNNNNIPLFPSSNGYVFASNPALWSSNINGAMDWRVESNTFYFAQKTGHGFSKQHSGRSYAQFTDGKGVEPTFNVRKLYMRQYSEEMRIDPEYKNYNQLTDLLMTTQESTTMKFLIKLITDIVYGGLDEDPDNPSGPTKDSTKRIIGLLNYSLKGLIQHEDLRGSSSMEELRIKVNRASSLIFNDGFSNIEALIVNSTVKQAMDNSIGLDSYRIIPTGGEQFNNIRYGSTIGAYNSTFGIVNLVHDEFAGRKYGNGFPVEGNSSTPVPLQGDGLTWAGAVVPTSAVNPNSKWKVGDTYAPAGEYYKYYVVAMNTQGKNTAMTGVANNDNIAVIQTAEGESVTLTIPRVADAEYYEVFRSTVGVLANGDVADASATNPILNDTQVDFIGAVAQPLAGDASFIDHNDRIAGCSDVWALDTKSDRGGTIGLVSIDGINMKNVNAGAPIDGNFLVNRYSIMSRLGLAVFNERKIVHIRNVAFEKVIDFSRREL